jgi:TPR repeat protein
MYELGRLYLSFKCGPDRGQAFKWFSIGAKLGSAESKDAADQLAKALTARQRKHAVIAAEKWIKDHPGNDKEEDEDEKR